jgi:hypothetical protein
LLHTDTGQQYLKVCLLEGEAAVDLAKATLVDVPIPQQAEQYTQLEITALVGEVLILIDGEIAPGQAILAVKARAQRSQGPADATARHRAVVITVRPAKAVTLEQEVEGAERLGDAAFGNPPLGDGLENTGKVPAGGGEHFLRLQRILCPGGGGAAQKNERAAETIKPTHQPPPSPACDPWLWARALAGKFGGKLLSWRQIS